MKGKGVSEQNLGLKELEGKWKAEKEQLETQLMQKMVETEILVKEKEEILRERNALEAKQIENEDKNMESFENEEKWKKECQEKERELAETIEKHKREIDE